MFGMQSSISSPACDWVQFTMILLSALLVSAIVIILVTFFVNKNRDKQYLNSIKEETSTIRVYRIDAPAIASVISICLISEKVRNITLEQFYLSFPSKEQRRVKEWISEILDGKQAPQYLQTDVIFHQEKRQVPSFLKISKADPSKASSISKAICSATKGTRSRLRSSPISRPKAISPRP
jgi:hypothetical protein